MPILHVLPLGISLTAPAGAVLRDVLQAGGVLLDSPCGGKGTCRQCKVMVEPAPSKSGAAGAEVDGGYLSCQLRVSADCTVTIPGDRQSSRSWKQGLRDEDLATSLGAGSMRVVSAVLSEPSLEDQTADWERLERALAAHGVATGVPDTAALESLSLAMRRGGWRVRALCEEKELIAVDAEGSGGFHGFAVDLGTTTVDIALVDLETGQRRGRRAFLNAQVAFGADVVSRAQSFHSDRGPVRSAVIRTIDEGGRKLLTEAGVAPSQVVKTVVVGNPIMIHILNGIDPYQLTHVPYVTVCAGSLHSRPRDMGWTFQERGYVETLPLISAYVGADTIAMIVALDLQQEKATTLSIDIGTNGEMVLARNGDLLATSTAAGPAFEGAEISCGMRALEGAVYGVQITEDGQVTTSVVGDGHPKGICGTGLIAGIAELLERGVIDTTGRIVDSSDVPAPRLRERLFTAGSEPAFALSDDRSVYISQGDVRKLQLAKGAVRTGIETLLEVSGLAVGDLDSLRLAGNFGAGLDARSAMRIGLIPTMELSGVQVVGNAALRGALMALVSREKWRASQSASRVAKFIELGGKPEFQARFMDAIMF